MPSLQKIYESFNLPNFTYQKFAVYYEKIIEKALNGHTSNIYTFKSVGITSRLKYIVSNRKLFGDKRFDEYVFIFIDLQKYILSQSTALSESLQFINNAPTGEIDLSRYFEIIRDLIQQEKKVFFIVGDGGLLYFDKDPQCIALVDALRLVSFTDTNFIFINQKDNTQLSYVGLDVIGGFLNKNIVWGKELYFDAPEITHLLQNESKRNNTKVNENIVGIISELSEGDPKVAIYLYYKWKEDNKALEQLLKNEPKVIYETLDSKWLDARYASIVSSLTDNTYNDLLAGTPNEYLANIGLNLYMNPLFNFYLTERCSTRESKNEFKLTGQEQILYSLLNKFKDETITRDDISEALWGDKADENYSDWAINKVVSELRKKINSKNLEIKSVKGVGYILTKKQ